MTEMDFGTGMEMETLVLAAVIIFGSHAVKGATGFANALIAIPLLSLLMDIKFVVPMFLLFDFPSSGMIAVRNRSSIKWKTAAIVFSGLIVGTTIGAYFLINLSSSFLRILFGVFVAVFGLNLMVRHQEIMKNVYHWKWGVLTGILGGTTGGMFGMDGPIIVMYLSKLLHKTAFRATLTTIFLLSSFWRGSLYAYGGLLGRDALWFAILMSPFLVAGVLVGSRFQHSLDQRSFNIIIGIVLVIAGILLIVR